MGIKKENTNSTINVDSAYKKEIHKMAISMSGQRSVSIKELVEMAILLFSSKVYQILSQDESITKKHAYQLIKEELEII
jgi:hypothetical protein